MAAINDELTTTVELNEYFKKNIRVVVALKHIFSEKGK